VELYQGALTEAQNCRHCEQFTPLRGHKPVKNTVIPDLRGPLGRDPDFTSVGFVLWMPACAGMTNRSKAEGLSFSRGAKRRSNLHLTSSYL
jgi:hypothetical protein